MGPDHLVESILSGAVRVVPDVPSFAVDDGFVYAVPDGLDLGVGDVVRVPLAGRRVRGWVIGRGSPGGKRLKEVAGRWGELPVFDDALLSVARWAAGHYVAPMAPLLAKTTPPNVPRWGVSPRGRSAGPAPERPEDRRLVAWLGAGPWSEPLAERISATVAAGQSVVVALPTWSEALEVAEAMSAWFGPRVVVGSSHLPAAEATAAWVEAATSPGRIVVGTRDVAWWRAPVVGLGVIVGEGRRGLKDKATPTVHARDVLRKRSQEEGFPLLVCDAVPTAETIAAASVIEQPAPGRLWGLIEVVDRRTEPPDGSLLGETCRRVLRVAAGDGKSALVFTHRRAAAQRCVRCRELRRCVGCGANPGTGAACRRCGSGVAACSACGGARFEMLGSGVARLVAEVSRLLGSDLVGEAGSGRRVVVGTERDLPGLQVDLTVIVDADGLLLAPTYRAAEDGLRILARAVAAAGRGPGRRALLQTMQPEHAAIQALRRADPVPFVRQDGERRAGLGLPPGGELLVVEAGDLAEGWAAELTSAVGDRAQVFGPAVSSGGMRWLIQGPDLDAARVVLRSVVARWREAGARVRIDADPMDL